ncbi:MAG: LysE family translocator [Sphingomonadales bacterium]
MDMFFHAFTIGLILSIMPGPVFFVLLEKSITKGIRSALAIDLGVILSDVVYILLAVLFVEQINTLLSGENKELFDRLGGLIFIVYGIVNLIKKTKIHDGDQELEDVTEKYHLKESADPKKNFGLLIAKGFLLNFANPLVVFYWLSVASVAKRESPNDTNLFLFFYLGVILLTYFAFDIIKISAAKKIRNLVTEKLLNVINKIIGMLFISFGLFFIFRSFI